MGLVETGPDGERTATVWLTHGPAAIVDDDDERVLDVDAVADLLLGLELVHAASSAAIAASEIAASAARPRMRALSGTGPFSAAVDAGRAARC